MKKTYVMPSCETIELGVATLIAQSPTNPSISGKTDGGPDISFGGDTKEDGKYDPW